VVLRHFLDLRLLIQSQLVPSMLYYSENQANERHPARQLDSWR
jgi:hypothetical protein